MIQRNKLKVVDSRRARIVLSAINWSFSDQRQAGQSHDFVFDCRKHHWFAGSFIPEIPYSLIEVLTKPGAVVFDPFAGIGTTIFQALLLGRTPYATEISRVAIDFMTSLWVLFSPQTNASAILSAVSRAVSAFDFEKDYAALPMRIRKEELRPWFPLPVFNEIMFLAALVERAKDRGTKAALRIALSSTLRSVCAQDRGGSYIADNVHPTKIQLKRKRGAIVTFERKLRLLLADVNLARSRFPYRTVRFLASHHYESQIARVDVRHLSNFPPDECVDLIVTSPPYPNMTDYATSQRLSYYLLGSDPREDLPEEIGARRKRHSPQSLSTYREDMRRGLERISMKLKNGGCACFVMATYELDKPADSLKEKIVQESLANLPSYGLVLDQYFERFLPKQARYQKRGSLKKERIYIYRKVI